MDLSCAPSCTNSLKINDGSGTTALTQLHGVITSAPVVITNARETSFIGGEIGASSFTGAGLVSITGAVGLVSVTPSGGTYSCAGNFNINCPGLSFTNSLAANVNLTNTGVVDGPSVAQGATGTWFASGTVLITATSGNVIACKLWDGTTVIASTATVLGNTQAPMPLSGILTSPAGNIKISCENASAATGTITASNGLNANASTISAVRVQ
jgi:hypothetical protein